MASFHALGYEADSIADETLPYPTVRLYEDEIRSVERLKKAPKDSSSVEVPGSIRVQIRVQLKRRSDRTGMR